MFRAFLSLILTTLFTTLFSLATVSAGSGPTLTWDLKWNQSSQGPVAGGGGNTFWSVWAAATFAIENRAHLTTGWERSFVTVGEVPTELSYAEEYDKFQLATGGTTLKPFISSDWSEAGCSQGPSVYAEVSAAAGTITLTNTTGGTLYLSADQRSKVEGRYNTLANTAGSWLVLDPGGYVKVYGTKADILVQNWPDRADSYRCATVRWDVNNYNP